MRTMPGGVVGSERVAGCVEDLKVAEVAAVAWGAAGRPQTGLGDGRGGIDQDVVAISVDVRCVICARVSDGGRLASRFDIAVVDSPELPVLALNVSLPRFQRGGGFSVLDAGLTAGNETAGGGAADGARAGERGQTV